MILSDLLGSRVVAAVRSGEQPELVGYVTDVRFQLTSADPGDPPGTARLYGIIVSPHRRATSLGYERSGVNAPWLVATIARRRHRGSFLVSWGDIAELAEDRITLRPGFSRSSSQLPTASPR